MKISRPAILTNVRWTVGAYGAGELLRLATNVVLARLLAPEIFGVMVIVNSVRTGIDLFSDVGIGQNIVHNRSADKQDFYDTAWSLQLLRGVFLWVACAALAIPIAHFYEVQILALILPVAGLAFVLAGISSTSRFLLQRRLQLAKLNAFDVAVGFITAIAHVVFAYISPTIWALIYGGLVAYAAGAIGSYFLLPDVRHRFHVSKQYAWEIFTFGKWIFISSIVYFLSINFDRLYLATVMPLGLLGVYGIARSLSELVSTLVLRLGNIVVFPLVASSSDTPRTQLREQLALMRVVLLLVAAVGLSFLAASADFIIQVLFDERYQAAGWMLPVLFIGAWFSILCSINESTLMGFGKPHYGALANSLKFGYLVIGLPLGFSEYGVLGAITVVALGDLWRYIPILVGQIRERFSFWVQDLLVTFSLFALIGFWEWLRWTFGLGTSFDGLPISGGI